MYSKEELASLLQNGAFSTAAPASLVRMVALGMSGRVYVSNSLFPQCDSGDGSDGYNNTNNNTGASGPFASTLNITHSQGDCGRPPSGAVALSAHTGIPDSALRSLSYYLDNTQGTVLLKRFDLAIERSGNAAVDTTSLPEGRYPVRAVWEYYDETYSMLQETSASGELIVDRLPPAAQLTYPAGNSLKLCPVITHTNGTDQYTLPVEASITDSTAVARYELSYGSGEDPDTWYSAIDPSMRTPDNSTGQIFGNGPVKGRIGAWDISKRTAGTYTLRLKASDTVGNVSCTTATFSYDAPVDILNLLLDHRLISSNSTATVNTTAATYEIDTYATVEVNAFKLLQTAGTYTLDSTSVKKIAAGMHHMGGIGEVDWNGRGDGGAAVPDGLYGIDVHAVDGCGSSVEKWTAVEVDGTSPEVDISYPKPGDPLGNVVEVKGSASDKHLRNYVLEAGLGESPDTWTPISTGTSPVTDSVLGVWNTFGLKGRWTLRLSAWDNPGNKDVTAMLITFGTGTRSNLISSLSATPTLISPNKDGKLDASTIQYELTDTCDTKIEIIDTRGVVRKTFSASIVAAGLQALPWDGTDEAGATLADGSYSIRLTAVLSSTPEFNQVEAITAAIDTTPPAIAVSKPLNNSYLKNNITVSGSITDSHLSEYAISLTGPAGTVQVDQGTQTRDNYVFGILNELADGVYTLNVKTKDLGGNVTEQNILFTVDKTAPVVSFDALNNAGYYGGANPDVNISGGLVESNIDSFSLRFGKGEEPLQWTALASGTAVPVVQPMFSWKVGPQDGIDDGVYTLSLLVTDKAGSSADARAKIIVDNNLPVVSITSPGEGDVIASATDVSGTAFDQNLDTYTIDFSSGQCDEAYQWATIKTSAASVHDGLLASWQAMPPDGPYCLRVSAVDKSGNTTQATVDVKVNAHPPAPPVLSVTMINKITANLTWTSSNAQGVAGYNVYRNGQKINSINIDNPTYRDENLTEGLYAYTVTAVDNLGLESLPSNKVTVKIDLNGPTARISSPKAGSRVSGLIDIKGAAFSDDDFKQYRVYVGQGAAPTSWTLVRMSPVPVSYGVLAPWDTFGLAEGQIYFIKLEAEDLSGNITISQAGVTIDNSAPATPHLISAITITNSADSADVSLTWQPDIETDLAGYLLYRNDQLANVSGIVIGNLKPYLISASTATYLDKALPDGTYTYYLMAMDQAGNISDTSNTLEVTIDTHPPHASIIYPADGSAIGSKSLIKATSPDLDIASVQFQYQSILSSPTKTTDWINLGGPVTSASIETYLDPSSLSYGDYRLRAVATDKGGNGNLPKPDSAPGFITITYMDQTPPDAPQGLSALTSGATVTLVWTINTESDLAGYNVYRTSGSDRILMNSSLIMPSQQPSFLDSGLSDNAYTYDVTAVDANYNESRHSKQATATVYAPVVTQPYTPRAQNAILILGTNGTANAIVTLSTSTASGLITRSTATVASSGTFTINASLSLGENQLSARVRDSSGNTSEDSAVVVVVYDVAPGAPTSAAAAVNGSDVHLTWDPNPEAAILGYNVYRSGIKLNKSDVLAVSPTMISASTSLDPYQYAPEMAIDSSLSSFWMPGNGTSIDNPAWWEVDLNAPELISHFELHWGSDTDALGNQVLYAGKDYEIQVWSGYAWIAQAKVTGNAVKDNIFDFRPSYRTDSIRVVITDSTDINSSKYLKLAEVSINKDNLVIPAGVQPAYDDLSLINRIYDYTISAVDNYGFESLPTGTISATVSVSPPSVLTLTATALNSDITLNWTASPDPGTAATMFTRTRSRVGTRSGRRLFR